VYIGIPGKELKKSEIRDVGEFRIIFYDLK